MVTFEVIIQQQLNFIPIYSFTISLLLMFHINVSGVTKNEAESKITSNCWNLFLICTKQKMIGWCTQSLLILNKPYFYSTHCNSLLFSWNVASFHFAFDGKLFQMQIEVSCGVSSTVTLLFLLPFLTVSIISLAIILALGSTLEHIF